jgi:two-component system, chemotaxis family, chemotaxis protein CheY
MANIEQNEAWKSAVRFLVVDDEVAIRKLVVSRLKKDGYKGIIHEAGDGKEALEIFYDKEVDCIICDWNMPNLSGIEFVEKVRQGIASENLAILMVTGESIMGKVEQALEQGVDDYLVKPFTPEDFKRKIDKVLEKIRRRKSGPVNPPQS